MSSNVSLIFVLKKKSPYVLICLRQFSLKPAWTNRPIFMSVVGYISHIA